MSAALLLVGDRVRVRAADDFYAYIDGWTGTVHGYKSGYVEVHCTGDAGQPLEFLVPFEQLEKL
ncbi:hypothetical protein D9X30_4893 [Cupriavidus sp. U2]|uniref:hypothetical protein n=1 Tax=Cupriavidus sp. U2 TaxID=2920269 RepID=UPI00129E3933|nr:hypothetical protein [Cupriavidus sp. U2]KAI3589310.1 hypothetical protein D9X30_4893 [Cupriavidus sp. U2]